MLFLFLPALMLMQTKYRHCQNGQFMLYQVFSLFRGLQMYMFLVGLPYSIVLGSWGCVADGICRVLILKNKQEITKVFQWVFPWKLLL